MRRLKKILSLALALAMVLTLLPAAALADPAGESVGQVQSGSESAKDQVQVDQAALLEALEENRTQLSPTTGGGVEITKLDNSGLELKQNGAETEIQLTHYKSSDRVHVMVVLESEGLLERGYTAQEIAQGSRAIDAAVSQLRLEQTAVAEDIRAIALQGGETFAMAANGEKPSDGVNVRYLYHMALSGLAVEMPYGLLEEVRGIDGVKDAFVCPTYDVPEDMGSTAEPNLYATQEGFGFAQTWNELGYTGTGMKVAVIDTGLDLDHPSFAAAPELAASSMTEESLGEVDFSALNAGSARWDISADKVYYSPKVPYMFNYVDGNFDVTHDNDTQGDHGTHVAGIVAANPTEGTDVVGVAPDAQILVMKVFGKKGGAYFDDIVAALEDSIALGVDAVNMSLGTPGGFDKEDDAADAIYQSVANSGMILAVAAGNSTSAAYQNALGTNKNLTSDPDNGIMSSPATFPSTTVVASMDNVSVKRSGIKVGSSVLAYTDSGKLNFAQTFGGQTLTYVMVPGLGAAEDYAGISVAGKVAVVPRGSLSFTDKQKNAADNGAIACIVYDNVSGDLLNMQDGGLLPNIFISQLSGSIMRAAAVNGEGTLVAPRPGEMSVEPLSTAGRISDFSTIGVSESLELTPDVTAPGGSIYSTVDKGGYDTYSGTSMASPHIAGMAALVLEYLKSTYPGWDGAKYHTVAEALIMSTATPLEEPSGILYSPRHQGAGAANVYDAVSSKAYLTVEKDGKADTPKVSLGEDQGKSGKYTFSFTINNLGTEALTYTLDGTVLTDQMDEALYEATGLYFMGETSKELTASVSFTSQDYDLNGDGFTDKNDVQYLLDVVNGAEEAMDAGKTATCAAWAAPTGALDTADVQWLYEHISSVTVPAGGSTTVNVEINLSQDDKTYMDTYYRNGIYVDGFIRCYGSDGKDLSLPFLAFYGDWSAAPVFDTGWWYQGDEAMFNRYYNVLFTNLNGQTGGGALGLNPYGIPEEYDPAHNALSPNNDGTMDYIDEIYLGMMRGAKKLVFTWTKEGVDAPLFTAEAPFVRKSYFVTAAGVCIPFIYSQYVQDVFNNAAMQAAGVANNDKLTLTVQAYLDDGDETADQTLTFPVAIDTEAPTLEYVKLTENGRKLQITIHDNHDAAALVPLTAAGGIIEFLPVEGTKTADGESVTIELDVSGYDTNFRLAVGDYAGNESMYAVSFPSESAMDPGSFYAYRQFATVPVQYQGQIVQYGTSDYNGWVSFTSADKTLQHSSSVVEGESDVVAAEYVDGYVIGIDENGAVFAMQAGSWSRNVISETSLSGYPGALDMAFDRTSKTLYVLTDRDSHGDGHLLRLNVMTGAAEDLGSITGIAEGMQPITLACDNSGTLYVLDAVPSTSGADLSTLYTLDSATGKATAVGSTGVTALGYFQSMTVDHATDKLYWSGYNGYTAQNYFMELNKATGEVVESTLLHYASELSGLFKPSAAVGVFDGADRTLTGLKMPQELTMAVGDFSALEVLPEPYYAETGTITWSSGDETVAAVSEAGVVTALTAGVTTITATANGQTVQCTVTVRQPGAALAFFDSAADLAWKTVSASAPGEAAVVENAAMVDYPNYFIVAASDGEDLYAFDTAGGLHKLDPVTLQGQKVGTNNELNAATAGMPQSMAFNHADGHLYAVVQRMVSMWESSYELVRVNPANGETEKVLEFDEMTQEVLGGLPLTLAIDGNGQFYSVFTAQDEDFNVSIKLVSYRVTEDGMVVDRETALNGYEGYVQAASLTYSFDDACLYMAESTGHLIWMDLGGDWLDLGQLDEEVDYGYGAQNTCLFEQTTRGSLPSTHFASPTSVTMSASYSVPVGASLAASVVVEPWNARAEVTFSVADPTVATVDENGLITGVQVGSTTLTATCAGRTLTATVKVIDADVDLGVYVVQVSNYPIGAWVKINAADPVTILEEPVMEDGEPAFLITAGAYYDGMVYGYGQDQTGEYGYKFYLVKADPTTAQVQILSQFHGTVRDMAVDYTTGALYAVALSGAGSELYQVNMESGEYVAVCAMEKPMAALAIDPAGTAYCIGEDCNLYTLDKTTGALTLVGPTGVSKADSVESLYCDYKTGNLYWAHSDKAGNNGFYVVDSTTGAATRLGLIGEGCVAACLYTVESETVQAPTVPATVAATGVALTTDRGLVVKGETLALTACVLPITASTLTGDTVTWSSDNTAVATVEDGVVTGVSTGTAVITATVAGKSASCTVTVLEEARKFYAYDEENLRWVSFSEEDPGTTTVAKDESAAGETVPLAAATLAGDTLYAYDKEGKFYAMDPDDFVRGTAMTGVSETTMHVEVMSYWTGMEEYDLPITVLELSYDAGSGKLYALGVGTMDDYVMGSAIYEVDVTDGSVTEVWNAGDAIQPGNLLVKDGAAWFVDCFTSGIINRVSPLAPGTASEQMALITLYWGEALSGRSLYEDPLTGTVYAIRDGYGMDTDAHEPTLFTLSLGDGDFAMVGDGVIGSDAVVIHSLFLR